MNRPATFTDVVSAILSERAHQQAKWPDHKHTVAEWIVILEEIVKDARRAWRRGHGAGSALHEIRQVAAVAVAAMEEHGAPLRPVTPPKFQRSQKHYDDSANALSRAKDEAWIFFIMAHVKKWVGCGLLTADDAKALAESAEERRRQLAEGAAETRPAKGGGHADA